MAEFFSRAFGLVLACDVLIPGLIERPAAVADVHIHTGFLPDSVEAAPHTGHDVWTSGRDPDHEADAVTVRSMGDNRFLVIAFGDGMRFAVSRSSDEIWCAWPGGSTLAAAATYLLGPVIGLVLRLRGVTCLHASAVAIGDGAIAIVGPEGLGKSTTAAAFALRGYRVIADDIAVLVSGDGRWRIDSTVPSIRLWEDSVELLLGDASALPRMAPGWDKRQLDLRILNGGFSPDASFLTAIYVLSDPNAPGTVRAPRHLSPREALMALVTNTYANVLLDSAMRAAEFISLSELVSEIPVWQVVAPRTAAELDAVCVALAAGGGAPRAEEAMEPGAR